MLNVKFFLVVVVKVSIFFVARLHSSSFETFVVYDDDDPRQSMNKKEEETSPDFFRVLHFQFIHIRDRRIVKRIFFFLRNFVSFFVFKLISHIHSFKNIQQKKTCCMHTHTHTTCKKRLTTKFSFKLFEFDDEECIYACSKVHVKW